MCLRQWWLNSKAVQATASKALIIRASIPELIRTDEKVLIWQKK